jgi:hypothetical protein
MSHVNVQLVIAKEAVTTKLAEWMDTAFGLIFQPAFLWSTLRGGKVNEELRGRI